MNQNQALVPIRFRVLLAAALCFVGMLAIQPIPVAHGANITVETTVDEYNVNGLCSLREAVYSANHNGNSPDCIAGSDHQIDAIYLADGATYSLTRAGSDNTGVYGDLDIINNSTSLDIFFYVTGNGFATIRQNANPDDRVIHIIGTQTQVQFSHITIEGGSTTGNGGGIYNEGRLTLENSDVISNSAGRGGGVYTITRLTVVNYSNISQNSATDIGGGVYNVGTMRVEGSNLVENTAVNHGGGVANIGSLTLELNSLFQMNTANQRGGGLYNSGGSASVTSTDLAYFIQNTAGTRGGAIYNSLGSINLYKGRLYGNSAPTGNAIYNQGTTAGTSTVTMSQSCLQWNDSGVDFFNGETAAQNAANNWWGNADGAVQYGNVEGDTVSSNVTTSPFMVVAPSGTNCWGQFLRTADMQTDSDSNGVPDQWAASGISVPAEGRQCDGSGLCYVRLVGDGASNQVWQAVSRPGLLNDQFQIRARIRANDVPAGVVMRVTLRITYTDGSTEDCELSAALPTGTYDWTEYSSGLANCYANTTYNSLQITIHYQAPSGSVDFDYVLLRVFR